MTGLAEVVLVARSICNREGHRLRSQRVQAWDGWLNECWQNKPRQNFPMVPRRCRSGASCHAAGEWELHRKC
eukprot:6856381-Karenia_brevis.AAC.1